MMSFEISGFNTSSIVGRTVVWAALALLAATVLGGCASAPVEHSYVTDYEVMGDRSIKYIYRPGDPSEAGDRYRDQALALEICSLVVEEEEVPASEEGDDEPESEDEGAGEGEDEQAQEQSEEQDQAPTLRQRMVERDCRETRILKTEEYR